MTHTEPVPLQSGLLAVGVDLSESVSSDVTITSEDSTVEALVVSRERVVSAVIDVVLRITLERGFVSVEASPE